MNCYFKVHWLIVQCTTHESSSNLRSGCQVQNMSSFYPGLSYKYLFMAYKNPRAAREQAIFLKRFKWQIKFVNHKTMMKRKGQFIFNSLRVCSTYIKWNWVRVEMISSFHWVEKSWEREHALNVSGHLSIWKENCGASLKVHQMFSKCEFWNFQVFRRVGCVWEGTWEPPTSVLSSLGDSPLVGHTNKYKYKGKYKYIKGLPAARTHRCINKPDSLC